MYLVKGILFLTVFFFCFGTVYAEVLQYFDEDGTLIVTDNLHGIKKTRAHPPVQDKNIKLRYRDDVFYDYYFVYGKNFQEVLDSTKINGPFDDQDNKRYAAQTRWNLSWSYTFDSSYRIDGSYVYLSLNIYDIQFRYNIMVLLPMLSENTSLNHHDLSLWENLVRGLLDHEHDHVDIIKNSLYRAEALERISRIKELTLSYDADMNLETVIKNAVESATAKIGHDFLKKIKMENRELDRVTEHGRRPEMREGFF